MPNKEETYGDRMRGARVEAGYKSAESFVSEVNAHLEVQDVAPISVSTYRKWEQIGTALEDRKLRAYPHPVFFPVFSGLTGTTAYWLWYGNAHGIVKKISQLPTQHRRVIDQQLASIKCPRQLGLIEEFTRIAGKLADRQRRALSAFLKLL